MKQLCILVVLTLIPVTQSWAQASTDKASEKKQQEQVQDKKDDTSTQQKKKSVRYIEETEIFLMPENNVEIA